MDNSGEVSAKGFKNWLFPSTQDEAKAQLANVFYRVIKTKYHGNPRHLYNDCKRFGQAFGN
jgi:hypothetical protein